jgi:hypothetical protein
MSKSVSDSELIDPAGIPGAAQDKKLTPEAARALIEAAERRKARAAAGEELDAPAEATGEIGGPGGLDPTRYNDWERKGRAIDFS